MKPGDFVIFLGKTSYFELYPNMVTKIITVMHNNFRVESSWTKSGTFVSKSQIRKATPLEIVVAKLSGNYYGN